jgi:hypothetical protein
MCASLCQPGNEIGWVKCEHTRGDISVTVNTPTVCRRAHNAHVPRSRSFALVVELPPSAGTTTTE